MLLNNQCRKIKFQEYFRAVNQSRVGQGKRPSQVWREAFKEALEEVMCWPELKVDLGRRILLVWTFGAIKKLGRVWDKVPIRAC